MSGERERCAEREIEGDWEREMSGERERWACARFCRDLWDLWVVSVCESGCKRVLQRFVRVCVREICESESV